MSTQRMSKVNAASDSERAAVFARADLLPSGRENWLAVARKAVDVLHAAALACDEEGVKDSLLTYEAAVLKLNGGTYFACREAGNPEAGGNIAADWCAAPPGAEPLWGQEGHFLIAIGHTRARVHFMEGFGLGGVRFHFHVVDLHRPFISPTGFCSTFGQVRLGITPRQAAEELLSEMMGKWMSFLEPSSLAFCAGRPTPAWLSVVLNESQLPSVETEEGQLALGF